MSQRNKIDSHPLYSHLLDVTMMATLQNKLQVYHDTTNHTVIPTLDSSQRAYTYYSVMLPHSILLESP